MRRSFRAQRPSTALAAFTIIATAGLLSACSSAHSGSPVAQSSSPAPVTQQSPVSQQTPVSQQSPASPAPAGQSQPGPAAVHLDPAKFSKVTVSMNLETDGSFNVHNSYRSPAVIARLTRIVNTLPAAKPGHTSCSPGEFTYRLSFTATAGGPATVMSGSDGCPTSKIWVDGKLKGTLWNQSGALVAQVKRLMHFTETHS